jgi:hypothetical protein
LTLVLELARRPAALLDLHVIYLQPDLCRRTGNRDSRGTVGLDMLGIRDKSAYRKLALVDLTVPKRSLAAALPFARGLQRMR